MARLFALCLLTSAQLATAAPDAQITARAELQGRQDASAKVDPSVLGWVSPSGASDFSDFRSCDFPQTLSTSGSFAQCCGTSGPCNFFTSCSANSVAAPSATVSCDDALCNTGVIVPTLGAKTGVSFLGCWASSLGTAAFTIVQDVGAASIGAPSPTDSQPSATAGSGGSSRSTAGPSGGVSAGSSSAAAGSTPTSTNVATGAPHAFPAVFGVAAGFLALL